MVDLKSVLLFGVWILSRTWPVITTFVSQRTTNLFRIADHRVGFKVCIVPSVMPFVPVSLVSVLPKQFLNILQAIGGVLDYFVLLQSQC